MHGIFFTFNLNIVLLNRNALTKYLKAFKSLNLYSYAKRLPNFRSWHQKSLTIMRDTLWLY